MKIVIAPQSFKGSLGAQEAARAMEAGVRRVLPGAGTVLTPVADGGDGTLEALVHATAGFFHSTSVTDPLGEVVGPSGRVTDSAGNRVEAWWGVMGDGRTAVIEMAQASGLVLVSPEKRDPRRATTLGTGQLLGAALDGGYRRIILGLGGSATVDGGAGAARALGGRFLDGAGRDLPLGGAALLHLEGIDLAGLDPRLGETELLGAADVSNVLCGPQGAAQVYGPQKGATPAVVRELDAALYRFTEIVRRDLGVDILGMAGGGAAGGLGAGLVALLGGRLVPGGDLVCDAVGLDGHLEGADLVLTGEGRLDGQTLYDKAPLVVARRAQSKGVPVIVIPGALGDGYQALLDHGVVAVEGATPEGMSGEQGLRRAPELVAAAAERALRAFVGR